MKTRLTRRRHFTGPPHPPGKHLDPGAWLLPGGVAQTYWAELTIEGAIDPVSGMIVDVAEVDDALARALRPYEADRTSDSSTELIAAGVLEAVGQTFDRMFDDGSVRVVKVRVAESDDCWVDAWS